MNTPLHSGLSSSLQGNLHSEPVFGFLPSDIAGLKIWPRFNSGYTSTGASLEQWDDASGNGNHLIQATALDQPQIQADGSILFDGIRQFLKAAAFTWAQPEEIFVLVKQVTWTSADRVFDGNTFNTGLVYQTGTTPSLTAFAGINSSPSTDLILDTYGIIRVAFNGVSSSFQIDNNTEITGDLGAADMSGFTLGAKGDSTAFSNIQVKEVIGYGATLTTAQRSQVINYLAGVGGLSI